jgi:hypothetical protein
LIGFVLVLAAVGAVRLIGCGETSGTGGTAGGGGSGGAGGDGGTGGTVAQCVDNVCRCTEAGILAAIAAGGAEPYTFDCSGPTTVVTRREIDIDNDVTLDGRGMLTIHGNNAHRVLHVAAGVTALLRGITVTGGVARPIPGFEGERGGGIFNEGRLTLEDCAVRENASAVAGGGITNGPDAGYVLMLRNTTVSGNTARISGGIGGWGVITLTDSTVSGNTGGGINCACELTLTNSTVSDNTRLDDNSIGGGIMHNASRRAFTLTNSTVSGNTSGWICGGIYSKGATITLTNSTVSYNTASSEGGGICVAGEATLTNSTVSHNTAAAGGGINNFGVLRLRSSTISENVATGASGGGAILHGWESGGGRVESSIATLIEGDCSPSAQFNLTSHGYNIESPGNTCGFDQPTDRPETTAAELNLGPLQDNGGPTMTHALETEPEASFAIDRIPADACLDAEGMPLTTDQRGLPRPVAILGPEPKCDVGSVEVQASN